MSVLITGIEMPKDKAVSLIICSNGKVYYEYLEVAGTAVPVPPHGRLGDMDALYKKMAALFDNNGAHKDAHPDDSVILRDSALYLIEEAPTIIPAEEGENKE